uniref:COMM domain-containing protein 5 n=1 Tax=Corethrella appendiculata TaxID=1370023 RepID=U5EW36_9DIPT
MSSTFKYTLTKNLKTYSKYIPELTKPTLRAIIQICVHYIETKDSEILDKAIVKLEHSKVSVPEHFCELFAAILQLIQLYLRLPKGIVKDDELRSTLNELKFNDECIEDIVKVLHNHKEPLSINYCQMRNLRTPPKRIQWRINISFLDAKISQFRHPTIILHIQKANDEFISFEISLAMFHRLRFNVASLLNEVQILERRQSMRKS